MITSIRLVNFKNFADETLRLSPFTVIVGAEVHVKERYFTAPAQERGVADGPGGGRKALGVEAARRIPAIRRKCPEDFDALARRVEAAARRR